MSAPSDRYAAAQAQQRERSARPALHDFRGRVALVNGLPTGFASFRAFISLKEFAFEQAASASTTPPKTIPRQNFMLRSLKAQCLQYFKRPDTRAATRFL